MPASAPRPRSLLIVVLLLALAGLVLAGVLHRLRAPAPPPTSPSTSPGQQPAPTAPSVPPSAAVAPPVPPPLLDGHPDTLQAQRELMFKNMQAQLGLSEKAMQDTREIFSGSRWMGQGNPKITRHPMSRAECLAIRRGSKFRDGDARCGAANMVALFDPRAGESQAQAKVCIDQYEYPNVACDYPVTWVRSDQAQHLCQAQGKRLCDAHEWEGGCAGALLPPEQEYSFGQRRLMQEYLHNKERELVWAYGNKANQALCATSSSKSPKCYVPSWEQCGTNTYPAGAFPACVSSFGVYDQHGNAAEHMNLPLVAEELGSRGGSGDNEMKGSWFIFARDDVHPDDCRWRALAWHQGRLMADDSHRNYHLGFRCCKDLPLAAH